MDNAEIKEKTPEEEKSLLNNDGMKNVFISQLRGAYKDYVNNVKPIPYMTDRLFHVDKVFVECGVQFLSSSQTNAEEYHNKDNLKSYRDIFINPPDESNRIILEADPGHGKSTLILQLTYDWCNSTAGSIFQTVDVLILLRLKEVKEFSSIYGAIKQYILPDDSQLNESDITSIIQQSSKVVIILDGFDEYPEKDNDNDITKIINRKLFRDVLVVLTTRSSCLPEKYASSTKRYRLTGFDENAQRSYITKVFEGKEKYAKKIHEAINQNPVIRELCQIPLFFTMFVHMSNDDKGTKKFQSISSFVRYVISCFHSHMKNKAEDRNRRGFTLFEKEHTSVDKVAFTGLCEKGQNVFWSKDELLGEIEQDIYNHFICTGIFVERDVLNTSTNQNFEPIHYMSQVRFLHKIFREWYAAHYVVKCIATQDSAQQKQHLQRLDPFAFPYLYLFACGLNPDGCGFIIDYLKSDDKFCNFVNICILEEVSNDSGKEKLSQRSPLVVNVTVSDTLLVQWSSVKLLEMASKYKIPIEHVKIDRGISSPPVASDRLQLRSELSVPALKTMKKLSIFFNNQEMSVGESESILYYSSLCSQLNHLELQNILMPTELQRSALSPLQSRNIQVMWNSGSGASYVLDRQHGFWKTESGGEKMNDKMYKREKAYIQGEQRKQNARRRWAKTRNVLSFTSQEA